MRARPRAQSPSRKVEVAAMLSMTGGFEAFGKGNLEGIQLALEEAKATGAGPQIELTPYDDASEAARAIAFQEGRGRRDAFHDRRLRGLRKGQPGRNSTRPRRGKGYRRRSSNRAHALRRCERGRARNRLPGRSRSPRCFP